MIASIVDCGGLRILRLQWLGWVLVQNASYQVLPLPTTGVFPAAQGKRRLLEENFKSQINTNLALYGGALDSAAWYDNSLLLLKKYQDSYAVQNLNEATICAELACSLTPQGHPLRSIRLNNLATCFGRRFERFCNVEDINKALDIGSEAFKACPQDSPNLMTHANSIGSFYGLRYQRLGSVEDLEAAIYWVTYAICLAQVHSLDPADLYSNLGVMMSWKYQLTGDVSDLKEALQHSTVAVLEPHDQPHIASSMTNLADLLASGDFESYNMGTRGDSLDYYSQVWHCESSSPMDRLQAARKASIQLNDLGRWEESSQLLVRAVELLSDIGSRLLCQEDQQYVLKEFASLGTLSAAVKFQAGKSVLRILRVLELGRGLIASLAPHLEEDLKLYSEVDLSTTTWDAKVHPAGVCTSIQGAPSLALHTRNDPSGLTPGSDCQKDNLPESMFQFGAGTASLRIFDENFMQNQLTGLASSGPLVVINESPIRCDAILIESNRLFHLPLRDLNSKAISDWNRKFKRLRSFDGHKDGKTKVLEQLDFLAWLWTVVAKPVLDALGFSSRPIDKPLPRVWWILTGQLSQLPIHAAGRWNEDPRESVMERVISSYSPSIKALVHSRQKSSVSYDNTLNHVVVAMHKTPDLPRLNRAKEEVDWIAKALSVRCWPHSNNNTISLYNPTKQVVLEQMAGAHVFHFAGHGRTNPTDPWSSYLALNDWQQDPLTVQGLLNLQRRPANPFLAYLSACGTGTNAAEDLRDAPVHMVSAFQIAGFRHTIGSLWEVEDQVAVEMAEEFYTALISAEHVNDYAVAASIHHAAMRLRDKVTERLPEDVLGWAAYVHFGA